MTADKLFFQTGFFDLLMNLAFYTSYIGEQGLRLENFFYSGEILVIFLHRSTEEEIITHGERSIDFRGDYIGYAALGSFF